MKPFTQTLICNHCGYQVYIDQGEPVKKSCPSCGKGDTPPDWVAVHKGVDPRAVEHFCNLAMDKYRTSIEYLARKE